MPWIASRSPPPSSAAAARACAPFGAGQQPGGGLSRAGPPAPRARGSTAERRERAGALRGSEPQGTAPIAVLRGRPMPAIHSGTRRRLWDPEIGRGRESRAALAVRGMKVETGEVDGPDESRARGRRWMKGSSASVANAPSAAGGGRAHGAEGAQRCARAGGAGPVAALGPRARQAKRDQRSLSVSSKAKLSSVRSARSSRASARPGSSAAKVSPRLAMCWSAPPTWSMSSASKSRTRPWPSLK